MLKNVFCKLLLLLTFTLFSIYGSAQKSSLSKEDMAFLSRVEDTLIRLADSMLQTAIPDDRIDYCVRFAEQLKVAMEHPDSYSYPFKDLSEKIHIISPPDNRFRIFNWMIAPTNYIRRYYGVIQMAGNDGAYYPLKDLSSILENKAGTEILNGGQWFGCEYYKILPQVIEGQQYYLLFGLNTNGMISNRKVLDILSLTENGPVFGAPAFLIPDEKSNSYQTRSRFILEYKKTAQVFLNYDESKKMVLFNRLASDINDPNRKGTYAPTGQTDGLRLENGKYVFVYDAIPVLRLKDGQAPIDGVMQGG